jgi:hypothetical protein
MHQQLWVYKVEEKLYLGVREQKNLNTARAGVPTIEGKGKGLPRTCHEDPEGGVDV